MAVDVALNWSASSDVGGAMTNPSLLWTTGPSGPRLVRAARVHQIVEHRQEGTWEGEVVTELISEWQSTVVLDASAYNGSMAGRVALASIRLSVFVR